MAWRSGTSTPWRPSCGAAGWSSKRSTFPACARWTASPRWRGTNRRPASASEPPGSATARGACSASAKPSANGRGRTPARSATGWQGRAARAGQSKETGSKPATTAAMGARGHSPRPPRARRPAAAQADRRRPGPLLPPGERRSGRLGRPGSSTIWWCVRRSCSAPRPAVVGGELRSARRRPLERHRAYSSLSEPRESLGSRADPGASSCSPLAKIPRRSVPIRRRTRPRLTKANGNLSLASSARRRCSTAFS
jgi:hypothetical protein